MVLAQRTKWAHIAAFGLSRRDWFVIGKYQKKLIRSSRLTENIAAVASDIPKNPQTSTRRRVSQFGIGRRSLQRILVEDLKIIQDKVQTVPLLFVAELRSCGNYRQALKNLNRYEDDFSLKIKANRRVVLRGEAHFRLC